MVTAKGFITDFVVGFGFINGLWIAAGVDPESEIIKAFQQAILQNDPNNPFIILFPIIPYLVLLATLLAMFKLGGLVGFIMVFFGFLAGALLLVSNGYSIFILVLVLILTPLFIGDD